MGWNKIVSKVFPSPRGGRWCLGDDVTNKTCGLAR